MRATYDRWPALLAQGLKPVYLVAGEEPLLVIEAVDALRAEARRQGVTERLPFDVSSQFDWAEWRMECRSFGLFAQRRLLELRLTSSKLPDDAVAAIEDFLSQPGEDVLLLTLPEWDRKIEALAWVGQVDRHGLILPVKALVLAELPGWVRRRARGLGVELGEDAVAELVARTEGNLLAASQELAKLALLADGQAIDALLLTELVSDHARFTVFALFDALLAGDGARVRRILRGLRREGLHPVDVLSFPLSQVSVLAQACSWRDSGRPLRSFWQDARVFPGRQASFERVLDRPWPRLLHEAMVVEHACKGRGKGDPWLELERWLLRATLPSARARRFAA